MTASGRGIILAVTGENSVDVAANSFNADLAEVVIDPSKIRFSQSSAKGVPSTWGEAVNLRIGKQNSTFRKNYQNGSFDIKNVK